MEKNLHFYIFFNFVFNPEIQCCVECFSPHLIKYFWFLYILYLLIIVVVVQLLKKCIIIFFHAIRNQLIKYFQWEEVESRDTDRRQKNIFKNEKTSWTFVVIFSKFNLLQNKNKKNPKKISWIGGIKSNNTCHLASNQSSKIFFNMFKEREIEWWKRHAINNVMHLSRA